MRKSLTLCLAALMLCGTLSLLAACTPDSPDLPAEQTTAQDGQTTASDTQAPDDTPTVQRVPDERNLSAAEYSVLSVVGTDDFGREILPVDGKVNADRYVGMFFFLTLGQHADHSGIYDINKITYEGTYNKAFTRFNTPVTPVGAAHFWGDARIPGILLTGSHKYQRVLSGPRRSFRCTI